MSTQLLHHFGGWRPDLPDLRDKDPQDRFAARIMAAPPPPAELHLRAAFPDPYDQGREGSCTANMGAAILQYLHGMEGKPAPMPSRQFLYWNTRSLEGTTGADAGGTIRDTFKAMAKWGVCAETTWPYSEPLVLHPAQSAYAEAARTKLITYSRVQQELYHLQGSIALKYPVGIGISVYESFESDEAARTGDIPMPDKGERVLGGHAIVLVGYTPEWFEFRNSWGTAWGDGGYGRLPRAYVTSRRLASDFWTGWYAG